MGGGSNPISDIAFVECPRKLPGQTRNTFEIVYPVNPIGMFVVKVFQGIFGSLQKKGQSPTMWRICEEKYAKKIDNRCA